MTLKPHLEVVLFVFWSDSTSNNNVNRLFLLANTMTMHAVFKKLNCNVCERDKLMFMLFFWRSPILLPDVEITVSEGDSTNRSVNCCLRLPGPTMSHRQRPRTAFSLYAVVMMHLTHIISCSARRFTHSHVLHNSGELSGPVPCNTKTRSTRSSTRRSIASVPGVDRGQPDR